MPKKLGPFSDAAKECITMFVDNTMAIVDQLAAEFGKTRHNILAQAGLGSVKPTRTLNPWNVFCKWYSAHYPKADRSTSSNFTHFCIFSNMYSPVMVGEYNEEMNLAYKEIKATTRKGSEEDNGDDDDNKVAADKDGEVESNKDMKALKEESYPPVLQLCFDWYEGQETEGSREGYRSTHLISAWMKAAWDKLTTLVGTLLKVSGLD